MVKILEACVNRTHSQYNLFKELRRLANTDGKSGHPQIHEIGAGSLWNEIQVNKIEIDGGGYRG